MGEPSCNNGTCHLLDFDLEMLTLCSQVNLHGAVVEHVLSELEDLQP